jgi:hypothetical protein
MTAAGLATEVDTDIDAGPASLTNQLSSFERSTTMFVIQEELAREHMRARHEEARQLRRGHQLVRARRLSRKAERAASQARLALARAL